MILKSECILLYIQVHLIHIFHFPRRAQALQFSVVLYCYIVQIHWRLTYKTPGLEESIIAPLTLLLHPPLLAFLPSLINRPALGASTLQLSSLSVCVSLRTCGHCVYVYLHMCTCTGVFMCADMWKWTVSRAIFFLYESVPFNLGFKIWEKNQIHQRFPHMSLSVCIV